LRERVHEFDPFVEVVPGHYVEGGVESAGAEERAWKGGGEITIYDWVWGGLVSRIIMGRVCFHLDNGGAY
jgi:hypothetical protein